MRNDQKAEYDVRTPSPAMDIYVEEDNGRQEKTLTPVCQDFVLAELGTTAAHLVAAPT